MSNRELRALDLTISYTDSIAGSKTIITRRRAKMGTEAKQLKGKLEELERALSQLKTQKDEEIQLLCDEVRATLELEQKRSTSLEQEPKSAALEAELDKHRALDTLRAEHQRALESEQKFVEEEKKHAHDWITDLKSGFELEKQRLQDKVSQLEEKLKTSESKFADPASTTTHVPSAPDPAAGLRPPYLLLQLCLPILLWLRTRREGLPPRDRIQTQLPPALVEVVVQQQLLVAVMYL